MRLCAEFHARNRPSKNSYSSITLECAEELSVTFDPEVDLSDDAVGRSRYERLIQVFKDIRESPIEGAFEVTFACKVEATNAVFTHETYLPDVNQHFYCTAFTFSVVQ